MLNVTYWDDKASCAFKVEGGIEKVITVRLRPADIVDWIEVGSRSHQNDEFQSFMQDYSDAEMISIESLLNLCLVAEGKADLNPIPELTSEGDTAGGGQVLALPDMKPISCNKDADSLLNPHFLVCTTSL